MIKTVVRILVLAMLLTFCGCNKSNEVDWLGSPEVANWDGYHLNNGFLIGYEIGFRSDGLLVWRERKAK